MGRALYLHHPSSLEHDTGDHPEQPARIVAIERALESRDWLGYEREQAPRAERAVVEGVHPSAYIQHIEEICAQGGGMLDLDTVASARSFDAAMHSAGGSVRAVEALLSGEAEITFCGLRPPGHHAEAARAMGFCLFNNVAIAARRALDGLGAKRVLVLDWDVHHGNGTNDIFYDTDAVLYFSIHQSPLYPGTGSLGENGTGAGLGYTIFTLETYKTFFFPSKPRGKFAGKPILHPDMLRRRQHFVPLYAAIWILVLTGFYLALTQPHSGLVHIL